MIIDLQYTPRQWQNVCHGNRKRFSVFVVHRRAGKTEIAIMELVNAALSHTKPLGSYAYIAPFLRQAKRIVWRRLLRRVAPLMRQGLVDKREDELIITFRHNGATIQLYGADNADAVRGVGFDGVVLDEVSQMRPDFWSSVVQPTLSDTLGWAIFIGTPNGVDLFSQLYFDSFGKSDWHRELFTVYDTQAILPEEIERLKRDSIGNSFAVEMLCDFSAQAENQLLSVIDVQQAAQRIVTAQDIAASPRVLGIDVARMGSALSVIQPRQGLQAFKPETFNQLDNMTFADQIARKIDEWKPDAVFIDAGQGGGVIDRLRQLRYDVVEVPFSGKAMSPYYFNKRAEMWHEMTKWILSGGAVPNVPRLLQDLSAPTYKYQGDGHKMILEAKDEMTKRGLPSPDYGDALALTFAHPVRKLSVTEQFKRDNPSATPRGAEGQNGLDYNPFVI
jgi:hypothetical protein